MDWLLAPLRWLADHVFGWLSRRRAFDAMVLDQTVRLLDAQTAGFLALLGQQPTPPPDPGDTTYATVVGIPDQDAIQRLVEVGHRIRALHEAGDLAQLPADIRERYRLELIRSMEAVRESATARRRRLS